MLPLSANNEHKQVHVNFNRSAKEGIESERGKYEGTEPFPNTSYIAALRKEAILQFSN